MNVYKWEHSSLWAKRKHYRFAERANLVQTLRVGTCNTQNKIIKLPTTMFCVINVIIKYLTTSSEKSHFISTDTLFGKTEFKGGVEMWTFTSSHANSIGGEKSESLFINKRRDCFLWKKLLIQKYFNKIAKLFRSKKTSKVFRLDYFVLGVIYVLYLWFFI